MIIEVLCSMMNIIRMGGYGGMGGGMGPGRGGRNFSEDYFGYGGGPGGMRGGYGGPGGVFNVHMRGLPFRVTEQEIAEWFSSVADPVDVLIHYNGEGR